ncbi:transposase [Dankookia sp. GCM10030260]|uniref:transposase n=1 Tax=Dankookia sp. GCM10030260 TaxID=3273390 RepID=UPI0036D3B495
MNLVVSDAHEGLKAVVSRVLRATWRRCRLRVMRNAIAHVGKTQCCILSAWIGSAFAEADADALAARAMADR